MSALFDHEKLHVYQDALRFVEWATPILDSITKTMAVHGQLDRASTSIPLNIAEGNGRFTAPDRCRFFDIARGSGLECAACLDVLVAKGQLSVEKVSSGKQLLVAIVSRLFGLIRSNSPDRVREEAETYAVNVAEHEQD